MHFLLIFAAIVFLVPVQRVLAQRSHQINYPRSIALLLSTAKVNNTLQQLTMTLTDKNYIQAPALDATAHAWHYTDDALVKLILGGSVRTPRMAAWKGIGVSEHDARDLVAYIKVLWSNREFECQGPKHAQCMQ